MPAITVRDEQGEDLLSTDVAGEGLGRYIKSAASLRSLLPLAKVFSQPISAATGTREVALALDRDVPVGKNSELTLASGASAALGVHAAGDTILSGSDLQAPVAVPNGTTYVSLALEALLRAGLAGTAGHLGFGFKAGTALRYAYFHPVDTVGHGGSVGDAVTSMLSAAVFPADAADLRRIPVGAYVSVAGEGELSFSAQATLSSATNLLATPGLPLVGSVALTHGASVTVNAAWGISGDVELRLSRPAEAAARLAFYRRRGRSLTVSARAKTGLSATVKGSDLIATLMRAISPDPEADLLALVDAGLDDAQITAIQEAIAASINRSLTLSAQFEVSSLRDADALFAYDIDLSRLDVQGRAAVEDALHGRLEAIGSAAAADGGPIRLAAMGAGRFAARTTSWRVNLLGILNAASFAELVRDGSLTYDPASGALTAADEVSARRIRVTSRPLESDTEQLRKVLLESLMVTAAYQASRALGSALSLTAQHLYLEQRGRTSRHDLEDHYRALIALGLCDEGERDARLGAESDVATSTFVLENRFDPAACDAMFLDAEGRPHAMARYEGLARQALLALVPATDPGRAYRRLALASDAVWAQVRTLGGAIDTTLPSHIRHDALRLAVVRGDVFTIVWWARAMHKAATELAAMRTFLGQRNAASLVDDPAFRKARAKLEGALAGVVATTQARFDDPWDVLAMDGAAAGLGTLEGAIVSTRFAVRYGDSDGAPAVPAGAVPRAVRVRTAAAERKAGRDWTAGELDLFSRHVVNLRAGRLSDSGSFASTREQVTRMFEEFVPAYARDQQAAGRRPRVMFYAHGGLVEEREGLLPVLARHRFWALNGIYPVYFIWETGLVETLRDIVAGGLKPTRAARALPSDPAIEHVARFGGKPIWGQMKKSAEQAAAAGGGAHLVAGLAGALWKALDGEIEFHALGHSAGSIFHAHFLPLLVGQPSGGAPPLGVRTLHFLAPAATTDLFKTRLKPLIGPGQPITQLAMYTMTDELEQADASMRPYGKSLLYLVSKSFEDAVPTPILGLQHSLRHDLALIRFFGLAGPAKVADVVFSKTSAGAAPRDRSTSITHGGFDNDIPTMTSAVRRVLDAGDSAAVVDYFEDAVPGFDRAAVGSPAALAVPAAERARGAGPARTAAVRRAARKKPWTVMVWMAGDNDLESFGDKDLAEMRRVGSTGEMDVVVQFDAMRDDRTRRYHVGQGGRADADVVAELGETNTGDPAVAVDFFRWAIERYPAERLLGVIWNHGSGIDETDVYSRAVSGGDAARGRARGTLSGRRRRPLFARTVAAAVRDRAIAYDDTARDFLDNLELKRVLAEVKRQTGRVLDVLGFDACLMNMVEVAYQLKGTARIVVGSEEVEPGDGWPYDRVLGSLAAQPALSGAALAAQIVDHYIESYRSGSITQSALDLSRLDEVAGTVDALAVALLKAIRTPAEYAAVTKALNATQRFDMPDFVDLGHFCTEVAKRSRAAAVKAAAKATLAGLGAEEGFVLAARHKGRGVANATGVAIYVPRGNVTTTYGRLDFAKATAWRRFLEAYRGA
jgi:hypothetical protein